MQNYTFTREELHELVWNLPINSIAKQLHLSGFEIRKICKIYGIPVPIRGYWRMIKANKKVNIKPLDKDYFGANEILIIGELNDL